MTVEELMKISLNLGGTTMLSSLADGSFFDSTPYMSLQQQWENDEI